MKRVLLPLTLGLCTLTLCGALWEAFDLQQEVSSLKGDVSLLRQRFAILAATPTTTLLTSPARSVPLPGEATDGLRITYMERQLRTTVPGWIHPCDRRDQHGFLPLVGWSSDLGSYDCEARRRDFPGAVQQ